jgi:hypothetical protein
VKLLIDVAIEKDGPTPQIARTLVWHRMKGLMAKIDAVMKALQGKLDPYTAAHLDESRTRIEKALDASFTLNPGAGGGGTIIMLGKEAPDGNKAGDDEKK